MISSALSSTQIQRIQAITLTVTNLDRAISFYANALCFELISNITVVEMSQGRIRVATLQLGDEQIRLMQYLDREGKPVPVDSQSNDLWFQHLAIVVSNMDHAYAHLQSFPIEFISTSPQTIPPGNKDAANIQAFKFRDPDYHPLELIWFPPDKGQQKWHQISDRLFLGIDHTAIAIANTERSLQFYCDFLGMKVDGDSFNWRETQARMDGLPGAKVRITALRPSHGGLGIELLDYVKPSNGRPIPSDLASFDIAYVQVELIVDQEINQFCDSKIQYTSQAFNPTEPLSFLNSPICRIKDPTGHSLLLIANQD